MRVLITGAQGFIGSHLMPYLKSQTDYKLLPISGRSQIDLRDPACLQTLPVAEAIVHLAGVVGMEAFDNDPLGSWQSNLLSTLHLLEHARRTETRHLILASSYVYGTPHYLPIDEVHPIAPHHAYQRSKYVCEQIAEQYAQDGGPALTVLRLFNVYGPGQDARMLIPTLVAQAHQTCLTMRDPNPRRDYVHVRDVVTAIKACLALPGTTRQRVFNIGSGQSLSVAELAETLCSLLPVAPELKWSQQRRTAEVDEVLADISRATEALDWHPQITLKTGLQELLCAS